MRQRLFALLAATAMTGTLVSVPLAASGAVPTTAPSTSAPLASADTAKPPKPPKFVPTNNRVYFNNPFIESQRFTIESYLVRAIKNTPKSGSIRISVYSFDRIGVARALINAHQRGVQVQIILNDHQVTRAQVMLHHALGTNPHKKNFAYECVSSCRGRRDNMHSKFYLFSRTGGIDNVVMTGSVNFTLNAVKWQWNDLLSMTKQKYLYREFHQVFNSMRHDYSQNQPYETFCAKPADQICHPTTDTKYLRVYPRKASPTNDSVLKILNPIKCLYKGPAGNMNRTVLRLSMHTMQGTRGEYIARRIRDLWAQGCDFKVIYGLMGYHVKQIIGAPTARGRIPLRSAGFDYDDDGVVNRYTHQKNFSIRGMYDGHLTNLSFTGSSNWTTRGTSGDEIIFSLRNKRVEAAYEKHFNVMFNSSRFTRNAYTTTSSTYRTVVTTEDVDGKPRSQVVTRTGQQTVVLPDDYTAGGDSWEDD